MSKYKKGDYVYFLHWTAPAKNIPGRICRVANSDLVYKCVYNIEYRGNFVIATPPHVIRKLEPHEVVQHKLLGEL